MGAARRSWLRPQDHIGNATPVQAQQVRYFNGKRAAN